MTLLSRTKEIAKIRGLSLEDIAIKAGLSAKSIYNWGKNSPKSENLDRVADVLHVSTDYLLERTDDMNPQTSAQKEFDIKKAIENDIAIAFDGKPISEKYKRIIVEMLSDDEES